MASVFIYDVFYVSKTDALFKNSLRKRCPYSELLWSAFFPIWTEYGEIRSISPYLVQMWANADQNNTEYGHFLRSDYLINIYLILR